MAANALLTLRNVKYHDGYITFTIKIQNTGDVLLSKTLSLRPHVLYLPTGLAIVDPEWANPISPEFDPVAGATWVLGADIGVGLTLTKTVLIPGDTELYMNDAMHTVDLKIINEGIGQIGNTLNIPFVPQRSTGDLTEYQAGLHNRTFVRSYKKTGVGAVPFELTNSALDAVNINPASPQRVTLTSSSVLDIQRWVLTGRRSGEKDLKTERGLLQGTTLLATKFSYEQIADLRLENPASGNVTASVGATTYVTIPTGNGTIPGLSFSASAKEYYILGELAIGTDPGTDPVEVQVQVIENIFTARQRPVQILFHNVFQGKVQQIDLGDLKVKPGSRVAVWANRLAAGTSTVWGNIIYSNV